MVTVVVDYKGGAVEYPGMDCWEIDREGRLFVGKSTDSSRGFPIIYNADCWASATITEDE